MDKADSKKIDHHPIDRLSFDEDILAQIFDKAYDGILITDRFGNILYANEAGERIGGIKWDEFIGCNVRDLVKTGVYDKSIVLSAIETRSIVTGLVKSMSGQRILSTSTPIFDKNGEIVVVITNSRDEDLVGKYIEALEQEKRQNDQYKNVISYLNSIKKETETPVAESPQMRKVLEISALIAKTDSTVIILGESGTGKEVIARYIHRKSPRSKEPFIPVNCAAIPPDLLESEFFGYVRGAFTGAGGQGKPGLFEMADKGTLFLDELAELPLSMQSKLLRVLESGEVKRLGATTFQRMNVRLIAATNRNLEAMVSQKLFRNDLYYRLNVIPLVLPRLSDRPEDAVALATRFLDEFNKKYNLSKKFSEQAITAFLSYGWPGNVRELRNVVERLVITSPNDVLYFNDKIQLHAPINLKRCKSISATYLPYTGTLKEVLCQLSKQYIDQILAECNGHVNEAAKRLGVHRSQLYRLRTKS
jgi:PAS domain S-box-containing protein